MFKIHDDKVYFVAETPDINKVIEIFLPKDDRGTIMDSHEFNKTGDIDFYSGELYLNAIGDVISGCDWSYKSQKKYRFGNVMNKNWLENISNSELYIAS